MWNNDNLCIHTGKNARKEYLEKYTHAENYRMLLDIYNAVIKAEAAGLLS
jgi:hypothetical protein